MGRFAVVTGASSGIGRATALRLAGAGWSMMLGGRDVARLSDTARECEASGSDSVFVSASDLADPKGIDQLASAVASKTDAVGSLVNAAGIGWFAALPDLDLPRASEMLSVNMIAPWLLTKALLPLLREAAPVASVVNITSDAAYVGFVNAAGYSASKAGLAGASRSLQLELRHHGVRVVMVAPGRVDTAFNSRRVGDRPGALSAAEVAEVIQFCVECSPNIELTEVRLDSMARTS